MKYLLALLILVNLSCYGQPSILSKDDEKSIDSVGYLYLSDNNAAGVAIGVIKGDKILYSKGLGVMDLDTEEPVTDKTVFHMASISKPFVSTAIMQLVEQGKINIDDKVTDYLPYFKMADSRYTDITVKQLMLHTAGIPDVGPSENYDWDKPEYDDESLERHVKTLSSKKLDFKPGRKKPSYSNNGYEILGDIVAKASGTTFEAFLQENLLNPTEMNGSSFLITDIPEEVLASAHIRNGEGKTVVSDVYPYNRKHAPSSCLHSSVEDMLKFAMMNMNQGVYNEKQIFTSETHRLLTDPQVRDNKVFEFGLAWTTAPFRDTERVEFTGGDVGFATVIIMVPDTDFGIVVLANADFVPPAFDVINVAYDIALKY